MTEPTGLRDGSGSTSPHDRPGMPLWVKVLLILLAVLVALAVITQLLGVGGGHGPGRHAAGPVGHTLTTSA